MRDSHDFSRMLDYDFTYFDDARRYEVATIPYQDMAGMVASLELVTEIGTHEIARARGIARDMSRRRDREHSRISRSSHRARRVAARESCRCARRIRNGSRRDSTAAGIVHSIRGHGVHAVRAALLQHDGRDGQGAGAARWLTRDGDTPKLGVFAATMLVMGGIVGAGIFSNPAVVARIVHNGPMMLGAWTAGGVVALAGAFVYAELAARHPARGGHYAYMRDAFHPAVAFMFGWAILLVVQTGGIAAVAVTFARYFLALVPLPVSDSVVATLALAILTAINCVNLRAGNLAQSTFMVLKIAAIVAIVGCGAVLLVRGDGARSRSHRCTSSIHGSLSRARSRR